MAKKKAAPKATRRKSDALSIRIDPRLKYGLEMASRVQRRPITNVVEWAIANVLANERIDNVHGGSMSLFDASGLIWTENEIERLLALWFNFPSLLTYEESRLVNVLLRTRELWNGFEPNRYTDFRWPEILKCWNKLKPVLEEAAERKPLVGLNDDDLERAGLGDLTLPF